MLRELEVPKEILDLVAQVESADRWTRDNARGHLRAIQAFIDSATGEAAIIPDLLAALRGLMVAADYLAGKGYDQEIQAAERAIAKAEGMEGIE